MVTAESNDRRGAQRVDVAPLVELFEHVQPSVYECRVLILPEAVGYSAHAMRLPGVVSQGDTLEEAMENIKDAFSTTIAAYRDEGQAVPFVDEATGEERPKGAIERWILVHV